MLQEQTNYLQQIIQNGKGIVDNVKTYENRVKSFLTKSYADFPIASNMLYDTKRFSMMCQGKVNTPMSIADAHKNSGFGYWSGVRAGTKRVYPAANSRIEVVTLNNLDMKGMPMDKTLQKAAGVLRDGTYYGSDIRVLLVDMYLPKGHYYSNIKVQYNPQYTGLFNKGQFVNQARTFVNVLAQSGTADCRPIIHPTGTIVVGKNDLGKKWQYKAVKRTSFYGHYNMIRFHGEGRIKVAIALPYASVGYHGPDNFVWAGFVGKKHGRNITPWTHEDVLVNG